MIILGRVISKKNNYRVRGGGIYCTKAWKAYEESALKQLLQYRERYTGSVYVYYTFEIKGKMDIDTSNAITALDDLLEKSGIIDNDKNIVGGEFVKYHGFEDWVTKIRIKEVKK